MAKATKTIESCEISVESIRRGTLLVYMNDYSEQFTKVIATRGSECREWPADTTDEAVEAMITENSRIDDAIVFIDGLVRRGVRSGWGFTIRV